MKQSFGVWLRDFHHQCPHLYRVREQVLTSCFLRDVKVSAIRKPSDLFLKLDYLEDHTINTKLFKYLVSKYVARQNSLESHQLELL